MNSNYQAERAPLLPTHRGNGVQALIPDQKTQQRIKGGLIKASEMYGALNAGKMPSQQQVEGCVYPLPPDSLSTLSSSTDTLPQF